MKVGVKCFAHLAEGQVCDWRDSQEHEVSEGETVRELVKRLGFPEDEIKIIFVNNRIAHMDTVLKEGDRVGLSPPVGAM
jgi:sulfur-carrier protein